MKKKLFPLFFCLLLSLNACSSKTASTNVRQTNDTANISIFRNSNKSSGMDVAYASITNPVAVGQWLESCRYSSIDQAYHPIYFRISDILQNETKIRSALDAYSSKHADISFPPLENDNLQYILMEYEVYFPDTFPESEKGIVDVDLIFNIVTPADIAENAGSHSDDGLIETDGRDYKILSNAYDLTDKLKAYSLYAGDTWTKGKFVFVLNRSQKDFLIRYCYYLNENPIACYIQISL